MYTTCTQKTFLQDCLRNMKRMLEHLEEEFPWYGIMMSRTGSTALLEV